MKANSRLVLLLIATTVCCGFIGCGRPAQLGVSDQAWATADALWTAVGSRRPDLLAKVSKDVDQLRTSGAVGDDTFAALNSIIATADAGDWASARKNLRAFVEGQRRPR